MDGRYQLRSLYFGTPGDRTLREKLYGVNRREKFRIRYYNSDLSFIHLEKKSKLVGGLGNKQKVQLTAQEVQALLDGRYDWMMDGERSLLSEFYIKLRNQCLQPKAFLTAARMRSARSAP